MLPLLNTKPIPNGNDNMTSTLEYRKIQQLDGKAAVFVRGMLDFIEAHPLPEIPLRKAQEAGQHAVEELEETISVPYISKLSVLLQQARIIRKERRGQKFIVFRDIHYSVFRIYMEGKSYGESLTKELPIDQVMLRSAFIDHMQERGSVRISIDKPLAKAAYQVAMDKFKRGEYDMVFIKREYQTILAVDHDKGIEEEVVAMNVHTRL